MRSPHLRNRLALATVAVWGILSVSGCTLSGFKSKFQLQEVDGTESEDPWTTQAGAEGRAGRPVEKEADPLGLRNLLMSEKAREIERNCGFE